MEIFEEKTDANPLSDYLRDNCLQATRSSNCPAEYLQNLANDQLIIVDKASGTSCAGEAAGNVIHGHASHRVTTGL